jgi:hypothetical protein
MTGTPWPMDKNSKFRCANSISLAINVFGSVQDIVPVAIGNHQSLIEAVFPKACFNIQGVIVSEKGILCNAAQNGTFTTLLSGHAVVE